MDCRWSLNACLTCGVNRQASIASSQTVISTYSADLSAVNRRMVATKTATKPCAITLSHQLHILNFHNPYANINSKTPGTNTIPPSSASNPPIGPGGLLISTTMKYKPIPIALAPNSAVRITRAMSTIGRCILPVLVLIFLARSYSTNPQRF